MKIKDQHLLTSVSDRVSCWKELKCGLLIAVCDENTERILEKSQ